MSISPRFPERRATLARILRKSTLKSIWKSHVRQANRQQAVADILDYYDVHLRLDDYIISVTDRILRGSYRPSSPVRVLLEKSRGLCRQLVIPDPIDALVLQTMVNALLPQVVRNQPTKNAFYQAQGHKISKAKMQTGLEAEYGSHQSWIAFQHAIFKFTKTHDFLVTTDIANFFDNIRLDEIRSVYGSFDGVNEDIIDFIFFILENYNWRPDYKPEHNVGLPQMNFDAPRLLAHSFLFELDRYLMKKAQGSYVRYMDDIDIGVATVGEAKATLRDIDLVLQTRGIRLNAGKTRILTAAEAASHFFVRDNAMLDLIARTIDRKKAIRIPIVREILFLQKKLQKSWSTPGYFDHGNGEKILKRYLTLLSQNKTSVNDAILEEVITTRPSLREYAFRCVAFNGYSRRRFLIILEYLKGEHLVDDSSMFEGVKAIIDLNCPNETKFKMGVRDLAKELSERGKIGFVSAVWLLSKFGTQSEIVSLIEKGYSLWSADDWLGRQVGAMYPRLRTNVSMFAKFLRLIRGARNAGAQATFTLHHDMMRNGANFPYHQTYQYLKATSSSQPNGVTHQKILLLCTFLRSDAPDPLKSNLKTKFKSLNLDPVQKYLLRGVI